MAFELFDGFQQLICPADASSNVASSSSNRSKQWIDLNVLIEFGILGFSTWRIGEYACHRIVTITIIHDNLAIGILGPRYEI